MGEVLLQRTAGVVVPAVRDGDLPIVVRSRKAPRSEQEQERTDDAPSRA